MNRSLIAALIIGAFYFLPAAPAKGPSSWDKATQLYQSGDYKQALNLLEAMNSTNGSVHYLMGMCYKNLGNIAQAKRELTWVSQYATDARVQQTAQAALADVGQAAAAAQSMPSPAVWAHRGGAAATPMSAMTTAPTATATTFTAASKASTSNLPPPPTSVVGGSPSATVSEAAKLGWKPCTGSCLKYSDSGWQKMKVEGHPDSDWWMKFPYQGGSGAFTTAHCGHIIKTFPDQAPVDSGACPVCGGTSWLPAK